MEDFITRLLLKTTGFNNPVKPLSPSIYERQSGIVNSPSALVHVDNFVPMRKTSPVTNTAFNESLDRSILSGSEKRIPQTNHTGFNTRGNNDTGTFEPPAPEPLLGIIPKRHDMSDLQNATFDSNEQTASHNNTDNLITYNNPMVHVIRPDVKKNPVSGDPISLSVEKTNDATEEKSAPSPEPPTFYQEPETIRVSIGRIDIRLVQHQTVSPVKQRSNPVPQQSLDEYLKRHNARTQ
jgi:hypothetical protein